MIPPERFRLPSDRGARQTSIVHCGPFSGIDPALFSLHRKAISLPRFTAAFNRTYSEGLLSFH
jgi:hypothetical protein